MKNYICYMLRRLGYPKTTFICFPTLLLLFFISSCRSNKEPADKDPLFKLLFSAETGIDFDNKVVDNEVMNIFNYHNFYNGGGVAAGDINNDGKTDIFFTANQGENKLYINNGDWKFKDVTEKAGLKSRHKWHTGVTMADVNADGWLDIYVCNAGIMPGDDRANELYVNQKDGSFKEEAEKYGLDDKGTSTHAAFFDYDHDGDLDCFVLNNSPKTIESFGYTSSIRHARDNQNGDRLYRNDNGVFKDVSEEAGIYGSEIAFGLGVTVGDVNNDGWADIYVSNDFFEKDYLYINQKNGQFKEVVDDALGHMSNGSMGCDLADINNDGFLDIFTTEMLPENDYRLKTSVKFDDYDVQSARKQTDFHQQLTSNSLQLNNQDGTFSEISRLAGVEATGWSWGALCFDFNNDGWKDLFVCNGLSKDLTDQDFLEFISSDQARSQMNTENSVLQNLLVKMPSVPIPNYAFVNQKDLRFKNETEVLGLGTPSFSNGAAYADLDDDGDLDLIVNNVNADAFVYRNMSTETLHHHFLKIRLAGFPLNPFGYGARIVVYSQSNSQVVEQMPSRGFQSSVEPVLTVGLGSATKVDSIVVSWPNEKQQIIKNIPADTTIVLKQQEATEEFPQPVASVKQLYTNVTSTGITGGRRHTENEFVDFDVERLLPKMLSTEGPKLATADVDGDGREDFFMGASVGDTVKLFIQQKDGLFVRKEQEAFIKDRLFETTGAAFFDADNDGDEDLIAVSGGNQVKQGSPYLAARLYTNKGKGKFIRTENFPFISLNASCVRIHDYDGDGLPDIFIGARNVPGAYGQKPSSVLLKNNGNGTFADVTKSAAPDLIQLGMVTDAQWSDIDEDNLKELIVVGDWMPVTVFKSANGKLRKSGEVPHSSGWWNCLAVVDVNADGRLDLIGGNYGLNSSIHATIEMPAKLFVNDFDKNGQIECVPVFFKSDGIAYPYPLKGEIQAQIPPIKKKFLRFADYAGKRIDEIFSKDQLASAAVLTVEQAQSAVFINKGKGKFVIEPLPVMAQISPVFAILVADLNHDGIKDLFLGGNFYGVKPQTGRLDASYGTTFLGNGQHNFNFIKPAESGLFIKGEARDIATIKSGDHGEYIIVAINNNSLSLFKNKVRRNNPN